MNFKNCVYIIWKIQIFTILQHKITQLFTKKYCMLSKFSKLNNLESHFCELLRPRAPPFQKIKWNPWSLVTTLQKSCFLGPTIFEIPQPKLYYCIMHVYLSCTFFNFEKKFPLHILILVCMLNVLKNFPHLSIYFALHIYSAHKSVVFK